MGFVGCIPRFLKAHGSWILTALSAAGLVGTAVLVAKEAPVVEQELQKAQNEKALAEDSYYPPELTIAEKIDIAAPIYLPAVLVGGVTIGCMVGAQILNVKQQAALVAAYALLGQEFSQYRKEVRDEIGEEREKQIYISSQQKVKALQEEVKRLKAENGPQLYAIATIPGVIFEARPEHIEKVFQRMLFNLLNRSYFSLKELYKHIGLPKDVWNVQGLIQQPDEFGWDAYENQVSWGPAAVEFEIVDVERSDGKIVHIINTDIPPYRLGLDYGSTDRSPDNIYDGYDWEQTMFLAQASTDNDVETFEQPDIWTQPF